MVDLERLFSGYGDNYFDQQRQAVLDYQLPQLDKQYKTARDKLYTTLARRGQLGSTTEAKTFADLLDEYSTQRQTVEGNAIDAARDARGRVESTRMNLVGELNATADPTSVATSAARQAQDLNRAGRYQPVVNAFGNVLSAFDESGLFRTKTPTAPGVRTYATPNAKKGGSAVIVG